MRQSPNKKCLLYSSPIFLVSAGITFIYPVSQARNPGNIFSRKPGDQSGQEHRVGNLGAPGPIIPANCKLRALGKMRDFVVTLTNLQN